MISEHSNSCQNEARITKNVSFKIFIIVIPKESFGMTPTPICNLQPSQIILYSQCHTKSQVPPANPSFGMATANIVKDTFLRNMPQMCMQVDSI